MLLGHIAGDGLSGEFMDLNIILKFWEKIVHIWKYPV